MKKRFLSIRIDDETRKTFLKALIEDGLTVQKFIEQKIKSYLERKEKKDAAGRK
jgi:antitoxin component of RelBE/YafQ-DinJ toxin-antitoxin module